MVVIYPVNFPHDASCLLDLFWMDDRDEVFLPLETAFSMSSSTGWMRNCGLWGDGLEWLSDVQLYNLKSY
jgi:hypothetical protein